MKYHTFNEFDHFTFDEAQLGDVEMTNGMFHLWLDNVGILPENSCNRDIRKMRCNGMLFKVCNMNLRSIVEEGYRYYNADGKLMREDPDRELPEEHFADCLALLREGYVVSFEKEETEGGYLYRMAADGSDEHTYDITVFGTGDEEEWDRFLSIASSF